MFVAAVEESAGLAAIITAIGGVVVSLLSVYHNSRKTWDNTEGLVALAAEIAELREENLELKSEMALLRLELKRCLEDLEESPS